MTIFEMAMIVWLLLSLICAIIVTKIAKKYSNGELKLFYEDSKEKRIVVAISLVFPLSIVLAYVYDYFFGV